ncbi:MAG: hypothetical protein AB1797_03660 [bacterium]
MNRPILIFSLIYVILLGIVEAKGVYARGLSVSPPSCQWRDVQVGELVEFPGRIKIKNRSREVRSYTLRVVNPSELGANTAEGFKELPSQAWISFDQKQLPVGPEEWKDVRMFIEIPEREGNFDKKWAFFVEVKEDIGRGETFGLACYIKVLLATESKPPR